MNKIVYLSLGSNQGNRIGNLRRAIESMRALGTIAVVSPVFETEPVEMRSQRWFLNCAVALKTGLGPRQLLARLQQIEKRLGRRRLASTAKGPRKIDLDILLFGNVVINRPKLVIPHPAMHERRFVLEPLAKIAPYARHPALKRTVRQMRDEISKEAQNVKQRNSSSTGTAGGV